MYLTVVLLSLSVAVTGQKYTTKYDDLNLDDILKNERLLSNYFKCIMGKGKCTVEGQELKSEFWLFVLSCNNEHFVNISYQIQDLKPNVSKQMSLITDVTDVSDHF